MTITGLDPAYRKTVVKVPIYGNPAGGYYTANPALIPFDNVMNFWPIVAGLGTHNIIYNYQDPSSHCVGHDTVTVRVLDAEASIFFPNNRTRFCTNDGPFVVTGANIKNDTGTFSINGGVGLHDNGDNTATITPRNLTEGTYTITYTYFDGTYLPIFDDFEVGKKPMADFGWATECFQAGQPITFTNKSIPSFGYFTDSSFYWKIYNNSGFVFDTLTNSVYTFPEPGNYLVELQVNNTNGCVDTMRRTFALRPTIKLLGTNEFENFESKPISWQSGTLSGSIDSWKLGTPPQAYGYPPVPPDANIWYTYIPVASAPKEQSYVSSPCYDFTGMKMPMITMNIWRKFNANRDGANLQASADSGKTWNLVGQIGDGVNWYNSYEISGNPGGNTAIGWANIRDANWLEARHALDMLKDKSQVQFRLYYGSDNTAKNTSGMAFDNIRISERTRMALIEHFTNTNHPATFKADSTLDSWAEANKSHVIDIQYHTSDPAGDPFYDNNPVIPTTRQFYYGLSSVPYGILDGGTTADDRFDYSLSDPLNKNGTIIESLGDSYFELQSSSNISENVLNTQVTMTSILNLPLTEVSLRIAVIELEIEHTPLGNGDTLFRNVVKTMIPGAAGTSFYRSWNKGETSSVEGSWTLQNVNDIRNLRLVAFVQDESTKLVYQALMDTISLVTATNNPPVVNRNGISYLVYPNPVNRTATIELNEQAAEDITVEMYNNMGRLVHTGHIAAGTLSEEISVDDYPDGLYLLRLTTSRKLLGISKVIVSK